MRCSLVSLFRFPALGMLGCAIALGSAAEIMRSPSANPPIHPPFSVPRIASPSGYIFAGTVTGVQLVAPGKAGSVGTVQITFHVDQGLRGVKTGQTLTIHEWAGLWHFGERYRPGERVFLFLYQPSKLGLTSTVGGTLGRFGIDQGGRAILTAAQIAILSKDRNLGTRLHGGARISPADLFRMMRNAEERQR